MAGFEVSDVAARVNKPTEILGNLADIQNKFNQNKLFQAKALAGQYLTQSLDENGQPDPANFSAYLNSDKRTAPYAPEILESMQTIRKGGIANTQAQQDLAQSGLTNLQRIVAPYGNTSTASDPKIREKENIANATVAITKLQKSGMFTPDQAAEYVGSGNLTNDIRAAALAGAGGQGTLEAQQGSIQTASTPQGIVAYNANPALNTVSKPGGDAAFIPNQLGPHDLASEVNVVDPGNGSKSRHNLGEFLNADGTFKDGITPPVIDAGPLATTTRAALGQAYGPQIASFEQDVAAAPQAKQYINEMRSAGDKFDAGPNSPFWQKMGEFASEYHIKIDKNNVQTSAREEFQKVIPTLLRAQAQALGMNDTDSGRLIASASIPDQSTTPQGRAKILGLLEGMEDAKIAEGQLWAQNKSKYGEGTYGTFKMKFSQNFDPTIFQSQYMSKQDIATMQHGWSADKKAKWERSKEIAQSQGWVK